MFGKAPDGEMMVLSYSIAPIATKGVLDCWGFKDFMARRNYRKGKFVKVRRCVV